MTITSPAAALVPERDQRRGLPMPLPRGTGTVLPLESPEPFPNGSRNPSQLGCAMTTDRLTVAEQIRAEIMAGAKRINRRHQRDLALAFLTGGGFWGAVVYLTLWMVWG